MAVQPYRTGRVKEDPMDQILKGLSIASQVYGLKSAYDAKQALEEKTAREYSAQDLARKKEEEGILTKKEFLDAGKYYDIVNPEKAGNAMRFKLQKGADQYEDVWLAPKTPQKSQPDPLVQALRQQTYESNIAKQQESVAKKAFEKSPEGKLSKMGATERARLDNASMALNAVQGMADALKGGENTFSLIGDNPYTMQRTQFEEALGRMQSGGAISANEEKRFRSMVPKVTDTPEIQQAKLNMMQSEMIKRIKTMGLNPEDVGISVQDLSQSVPKSKGILDFISPKAQATGSRPPIIQNGIQYNWNPQTGQYE